MLQLKILSGFEWPLYTGFTVQGKIIPEGEGLIKFNL